MKLKGNRFGREKCSRQAVLQRANDAGVGSLFGSSGWRMTSVECRTKNRRCSEATDWQEADRDGGSADRQPHLLIKTKTTRGKLEAQASSFASLRYLLICPNRSSSSSKGNRRRWLVDLNSPLFKLRYARRKGEKKGKGERQRRNRYSTCHEDKAYMYQ